MLYMEVMMKEKTGQILNFIFVSTETGANENCRQNMTLIAS